MSDDDKSLRDTLSDAFDTVGATPAADPARAAAPGATSSAPDSAAAGMPDKQASVDPKAETKPVDAKAADAKPAAEDPPALKTPPGYPGGDEAFAALTPQAQEWTKAREAHFDKGLRANAEAAKFGAAMWGAFRPYEAAMRARGLHPARVVQEAMNLDFVLTQGSQAEKAAALQRLAQYAGVEPDSIASQADAPQVSPEVAQLQQSFRALVGHLRGEREQQHQAQFQQAVSTVDAFSKDEAHKHANDPRVRAVMADLLDMGKARDLEHAYKLAIWTQDDIRAVLLEQDTARRVAEARTAANEASPRGGAPVAAVMTPNDDTLRGTIERAWDANTRRVA